MPTTRDLQKKEWLKYRWEFMRRDPEYAKAHQMAQELRAKANLPQLKECKMLIFRDSGGAHAITLGWSGNQELRYETDEAMEILNLARSFDIIEFVNPQTPYDDLEYWEKTILFSQVEGIEV